MENPPKKFFRLSPGNEVRLRYAYIIKCTDVIKNEKGEVTELHCTYDPETKSGSGNTRSVKGTIHWVSAGHAIEAEVRLYDRLFIKEDPEEDKNVDFKKNINPDSLETITNAKLEPFLKSADRNEKFQFERLGYFCIDSFDSREDHLVFNRTVPLRDTWGKIAGKK
jgi:glutaminyl-tRNA synthetase